jgi:hypothetical protein
MGSCLRGTGVALYDYADFAETILLLPKPFFFCIKHPGQPGDEDKFRERFGTYRVIEIGEWPKGGALDDVIQPYNLTHIYSLQSGWVDGISVLSKRAKNLVHVVFNATHPRGERFAKISHILEGDAPVVPHIVRGLPKNVKHIREQLHIPAEAKVFCRYGGKDTFSIDYVRRAVVTIAAEETNTFFLFMNTKRFTNESHNIRFLSPVYSDLEKASFILTCDAMLHARKEGEIFSLAVAEFTIMRKRVITERVSNDNVHMQELGSNGLYYHDEASVLSILRTFNRDIQFNISEGSYRAYSPERVMQTFEEVFLNDH